jgi:hypothetical protein
MPRLIIMYLRVARPTPCCCSYRTRGKCASKKVVRFLTPPLARQPHDVNQHLREGVGGHRAIDSAFHLEIEEQATVAGQNRNAAQLALLLKSPGDEIFSSPGQSSCFSITQEAL